MNSICRALACLVVVWFAAASASAQPMPLAPDDRVLVIGNSFAERVAMSGYLEAALHAAYPDANLTIRHVPWSGDEVGLRPREDAVPTTEDHVRLFRPTVLIVCYGMSESFAGDHGLDAFRLDLAAHITELRSLAEDSARMVLVSPIAQEDLGAPLPTGPEVIARNRDIAAYAQAMREAAAASGASFVDLFTPLANAPSPLTMNGIHPTERGSAHFVRLMGEQLGWWGHAGEAPTRADIEAARALRTVACDKFWLERLWYRPTNTAYVWGGRHEPFGVVNFPPEMKQLERMIDARTALLRTMPRPGPHAVLAEAADIPLWESTPSPQVLPEDSWTPPPVNAHGTETSLGSLEIKPPDEFLESFTLPNGYEISCFASEQDFPELGNPINLTFDDRHRLWVMVAPTYPHLLPGDRPRCKLIVLEDTDSDGRADRSTIFADGLYIPTGFAVDADGSVYVGVAPDLIRLRDTDNDGRADRREIIAIGFAMPDSHHQLGAFEWDPTGGIMMHEGIFCRANVETPWGTRRTHDAAVWRFDPRIGRLDIVSHSGYYNPWGHAFDDYGRSIIADASGGDNFDFSQVISPFNYPGKPAKPAPILNRGRPTAGCEIIASRHFPPEVQGSFVVNQCIGFHGTRWDMLARAGSTWTTSRMPMDLVSSSDTNFRPVGIETGPDGTLYIADWCNPLIGHMQYSVRDPRRDHDHGRIWRVRYTGLPLVAPPSIAGADIPALLDLLRIPETNTRQLARRRLQKLPAAEVEPALRTWLAMIPHADALRDRLTLEALWILSGLGIHDTAVLERTLTAETPAARAGAVRMIRYWLVEGRIDADTAAEILRRAIDDDDQSVRLEALVACGFLRTPEAVEIAARASAHERDDAMRIVFGEVISFLGAESGVVSAVVERVALERMTPADLEARPLTELVARVTLERADVSLESRRRALDHVSGQRPGARARTLLELLRAARTPSIVASARELLLAESADEVEPIAAELSALATDSGVTPDARAAALAALLVHLPEAASAINADPAVLLDAADALPDRSAPAWIMLEMRDAVEGEAIDPSRGINQIARLAPSAAELAPWLTAFVDRAADIGFDQWSADHEIAMAALTALNLHATAGALELDPKYALIMPSSEMYALGEAIYHDEAIGCARCHSHDGTGLEGFPPLARSPWALGRPERAAAIVVSGLHGELRLPDGRSFDSAMEPLGSILSNEQIAHTLTYIRASWGNFAPPVEPGAVAAARAIAPSGPWHTETLAVHFPLSADRIIGAKDAGVSTAARTGGPLSAALMSAGLLLVPTLLVAIAALVLGARPASTPP